MIGRSQGELGHFTAHDSKMAADRHLRLSKIQFLVAEPMCIILTKFVQNLSNGYRDIAFNGFQNGGRPPYWICWTNFGVGVKPRRALGVIYDGAKFGSNPCSSFENARFEYFAPLV